MVIKLYGSIASTATLRVRACLTEKDLDFEFIPMDMSKKEHKKPEFLARNVSNSKYISYYMFITWICLFTFTVLQPFGQVPALEDGDLKLFGMNFFSEFYFYFTNLFHPLIF